MSTYPVWYMFFCMCSSAIPQLFQNQAFSTSKLSARGTTIQRPVWPKLALPCLPWCQVEKWKICALDGWPLPVASFGAGCFCLAQKKLKINITHKDPKRTMIPLIYCSSKPTWLSWRPHFFQQRQVPQNVQPDSTGSWHTDLQAPGSQRWGVDPRSQWHRDFIKEFDGKWWPIYRCTYIYPLVI